MTDLAKPISGLFDQPLGSKRVWANFSHNSFNGTPCCKAMDTAQAKLSIKPLTVEPSLAMVMKISPGSPLGYRPTVMYPSCPPTLNLWVTDMRSSGSLWRTARGGALKSSGSAASWEERVSSPAEAAVLLPAALRGCDFLHPSR